MRLAIYRLTLLVATRTVTILTHRRHRPANKAKPNTRFLRHIIKETKNHNAALLAKEAAESQARLTNLAQAEESRKQRYKPDATDTRRRQLGTISAILNGKRRRGAEEEAVSKPESSKAERRGSAGRRITGSTGESDEEDTRRHKRHRGREDEGGKPRSKRHHDRSRSRSPGDRERTHRHRSPAERDRKRSRSPRSKPRAEERGKSSRSKDDLMTRILNHRRERRREEPEGGRKPRDSTAGKRDPLGGQASSHRGSHRLVPSNDMVDVEDERPSHDSDPLEDLIGPAPPPLRSRGRGTAAGPSAMDGRFSANYDPKSDVTPDLDEAGDWEEAVETFRDRQKWKQQGADRLRTAGFTEDQIKKWEKGDDKSEEDVRWSKPGEGREWDRGKVAE